VSSPWRSDNIPRMNSLEGQTKKPELMMFVLTAIFFAVVVIFQEGLGVFDGKFGTAMNDGEFYFMFFLSFFLFTAIVIYSLKFFSIKVDWVFFFIFSCLFLVDVISTFSFPGFVVDSGIFQLSLSERFHYVSSWFIACLAFYVFFAITPKCFDGANKWNIVMLGVIFVALSSVIFSYIVEWQVYAYLFNPTTELESWAHVPASYTNNRNTYGTILLMGLLCSLALYAKTHRFIYPFAAVFFFANIVLTLSKTSLMCAVLFSLFYVVFDFATCVKKRPITRSFSLAIAVLIVSSPLIVHFLSPYMKSGFLLKLDSYYTYLLTSDHVGIFDSVISRSGIWGIILSKFSSNPLWLLFGWGDGNFGYFLGFSVSSFETYLESSHSGFFDVFGRFGIFGLLIYAFILGYFIYGIVDNYKHHRPFTSVYLAMFICVLVHGFMEDTNFLRMQSKDLIFLFVVFMPVLNNLFLDKHPENERGWEENYSSAHERPAKRSQSPSWYLQISYFLVMIICSIVVASFSFSMRNSVSFVSKTVCFDIQIIALFLSEPLFQVLVNGKLHNEKTHFLEYSLGGSLVIFSLVILSFFFPNIYLAVFSCLILSTFLVLLLKTADPSLAKNLLPYVMISFGFLVLISLASGLLVVYAVMGDHVLRVFVLFALIISCISIPLFALVTLWSTTPLFNELKAEWGRQEYFFSIFDSIYRAKTGVRYLIKTKSDICFLTCR
jgi:O-antigen ligase